MPNLVGIGLSQVPTNSMLGGLAYQDPEHASIKDLDLKNLSQINSEISDTANDVFVYDTRKDSDGGAWRKRTQHTSWYNETLNTTTRGSRREFPAVAVIVSDVSTDKVTIYDGDDPDLPMWMVISGANPRGILGWATTNINSIKVTALNGILVLGTNDSGTIFKFVEDFVDIMYSSANYQMKSSRTIADRNDTPSYDTVSGTASRVFVIVNYIINDVAMTVLPNAPIDDATGLPVPTIAVATNSGVSVIRDDGTVVDITASGYTATDNKIDFDYLNNLLYLESGGFPQRQPIPSADIIRSAAGGRDRVYGGTSSYVPTMLGTSSNIVTNSYGFLSGSTSGLAILDYDSSQSQEMVAYATTSYNTGWMHGDIKGAFLSDTTVESLTANTNLATDAIANGTNRLTSETYESGDTSWQMVDNTGNANGYIKIEFTNLVVGQSYIVSMTWDNNATLDAGYNHRIQHKDGTGDENMTNFTYWNKTNASSETLTGVFVAQTTDNDNLVIYANAITLNVSNFIVRAVDDEDRSVNNNGLQVFGTITKSAVATGADLVGYSGFSNSNYLKQPYNSDLDFGTDDFSFTWWQYITGDIAASEYVYDRQGNNGSRHAVIYYSANNGRMSLYTNASNLTSELLYDGINVYKDKWTCYTVTRNSSGTIELYINGELKQSTALPVRNLTNTSAELFIGIRHSVNTGAATQAKFALMRFSKSIPSPEQVKKMYEDEKVLFQENAKATLYGSSDAVTALAYDDSTNLLYAGTSSGRSEFQGLRRINNTTEAVTTAISASNGLVAEQ